MATAPVPLDAVDRSSQAEKTPVLGATQQSGQNPSLASSQLIPSSLSNHSVLKSQNQATRVHRSSIRPFFCCGSELSLVSLVDGMDLKDNNSSGGGKKSVNKARNSSLSSEEDPFSHSQSCQAGDLTTSKNLNQSSVVRRKKKEKHNLRKKFGNLRFRGRWNPRLRSSQPARSTSFRCDKSRHSLGSGCPGSYHLVSSPGPSRHSPRVRPLSSTSQFDLASLQDFDRLYPVEDVQDVLIRERADEMSAGIEVDVSLLRRNFRLLQDIPGSSHADGRHRCFCSFGSDSNLNSPDSSTEDYSLLMNSLPQFQESRSGSMLGKQMSPRIHTQVDFIHCLMPDLVNIMSCPFYWGVMDRYEAERLLDNKPEGTFLLRDSAQEDFLFSVSFRRYNRSLHARVEQWNHRFSFDAHDPGVFSAPTVVSLMEHYKDSSLCMFFEPMLTRPLPRNFTFSLQQICRGVICDSLKYDKIRCLPIPNGLKQFLQIYHYKQKVRVRHFDGSDVTCHHMSPVL